MQRRNKQLKYYKNYRVPQAQFILYVVPIIHKAWFATHKCAGTHYISWSQSGNILYYGNYIFLWLIPIMYNLYVMDIKSSDKNCSYTRTLHPMSIYFAVAFSNDNLFITFFHTSPPLFNVKNVKTTSLQSYNYENTMFVFRFFFLLYTVKL